MNLSRAWESLLTEAGRRVIRSLTTSGPREMNLRILAIALLVRVAAIVVSGFETTRFGDAEAYMRTAELLLKTGSYPDNAEALPIFRAPGYPVFLLERNGSRMRVRRRS